MTISSILSTPVKQISVHGGDVYHILKQSDQCFDGFGEAYISFIEYDHIKGWKRHLRMSMNLVVPFGLVEFYFTEDFSSFRKFTIGTTCYSRLGSSIYMGCLQGLSEPTSIIFNIASIEHDPDEVERLPLEFNSVLGNPDESRNPCWWLWNTTAGVYKFNSKADGHHWS